MGILGHFVPRDIFGLGNIRTFGTISSFYVSNLSNISQYAYYSQKELKHFCPLDHILVWRY